MPKLIVTTREGVPIRIGHMSLSMVYGRAAATGQQNMTGPTALTIIGATPVPGLFINCGWGTGGFKATPASGCKKA